MFLVLFLFARTEATIHIKKTNYVLRAKEKPISVTLRAKVQAQGTCSIVVFLEGVCKLSPRFCTESKGLVVLLRCRQEAPELPRKLSQANSLDWTRYVLESLQPNLVKRAQNVEKKKTRQSKQHEPQHTYC